MENLKFSKGDRYDIPLQLSFFATLSGTLQQQGYFSEHDSLGFAILFTGRGLKEKTEYNFEGKWLREENLLIYLIDQLVEVNIVTKHKLNSIIEKFFNIKNVAAQRYSYEPRKPKNYKEIDSIIVNTINELNDHEDKHRELMTMILEKAKGNE